MGLFGLFSKKKPVVNEVHSKRDDLDHLTSSGDLPWGWVTAYKNFTDPISKEYAQFSKSHQKSEDKSPKEQYAALKSLVVYMNDVKKLCSSKGECFDLWRKELLFSDKELKEYTNRLEYIKDNFDDLEDLYQRNEYIKKCVLPQIPKIIRKTPGILQTDIYKLFPVDCKVQISSRLYELDKAGKIIREKSGRSYSLKMKQ